MTYNYRRKSRKPTKTEVGLALLLFVGVFAFIIGLWALFTAGLAAIVALIWGNLVVPNSDLPEVPFLAWWGIAMVVSLLTGFGRPKVTYKSGK